MRTTGMFVWLMPLQWLAGIGFALWVPPTTFGGEYGSVHAHLLTALYLGSAITAWPVYCAIRRPGDAATRYIIAIAQMLMGALLIHLSGGRIATHFHVFGSLAFLACYRDWRVLVAASAVVAVDHIVRGAYYPLSICGVLTVSPYMWMEHAAWVVFEDVFLIISIRQSVREMLGIARRQAALESVNAGIAGKSVELTREITERKNAQAEMERLQEQLIDASRRAGMAEVASRMQEQLVDASRRAGMAEVATSVIHNVGNVLNSVNVSHSVISERVRKSKIASLAKTSALLEQHAGDLAAFLTIDPAGQKVPKFLGKLAERLSQEQADILAELEMLGRNVGHIKEIIAVQQNYARAGGVHETLQISSLVENALQINGTSLARNCIQITREYGEVPPASLEKHKVMQILVNLVSNAKHALIDNPGGEKRLVVRTSCQDAHLSVSVSDTGVGIAEENLARIFVHGFTTKKDGHGFGLHSAVLAAREMGGGLTVHSAGTGMGATFTLRLPLSHADYRQDLPPASGASIPASTDPESVRTPVVEACGVDQPACTGRVPSPGSYSTAVPRHQAYDAPLPVCTPPITPAPGVLEPAISPESVESLRELATDDDDNIVTELIDTFLDSAPRVLAEACDALARRAPAALGLAAHTLMGSCSNFGANPLRKLSAQLEALARAPDFQGSPDTEARAAKLLDEIRLELNRVGIALAGFRKSKSA